MVSSGETGDGNCMLGRVRLIFFSLRSVLVGLVSPSDLSRTESLSVIMLNKSYIMGRKLFHPSQSCF